jgi:hypothetical protein
VWLDARERNGHGLICCVRGPFGLRRCTTEALRLGDSLAEITQAAVAQRRLFRLRGVSAHALRRFGFNLADRFFKRQPLAGDVRFLKRRLNAAQLADERHARAIVQGAPVLACILIQAADGPGN